MKSKRGSATGGRIISGCRIGKNADHADLLRSGPYRLFFYAGDRNEPPHIHVERDDKTAKFWLTPVRFQAARGFSRGEILQIQRLVEENDELLLRGWNEYFGT